MRLSLHLVFLILSLAFVLLSLYVYSRGYDFILFHLTACLFIAGFVSLNTRNILKPSPDKTWNFLMKMLSALAWLFAGFQLISSLIILLLGILFFSIDGPSMISFALLGGFSSGIGMALLRMAKKPGTFKPNEQEPAE